MKIILFDTPAGTPIDTDTKSVLIPDSAIIAQRQPVFLPSIHGVTRWKAAVALAFHIGRLGKGISQRFAPRYVDGVAPLLWLLPDGGRPLDNVGHYGFDNALVPSRWLGVECEAPATATIEVPEAGLSVTAACDAGAAAAAIAAASATMTLKSGDMIIPGIMGHIPISAGRVSLRFDGEEVINRRVI